MEIRTDLYLGDSKEMLKKLPDNSVDLIVTSPYANHGKGTYGDLSTTKASRALRYKSSTNPTHRLLHRFFVFIPNAAKEPTYYQQIV